MLKFNKRFRLHQGQRRGRGWGGFSPPTFWMVKKNILSEKNIFHLLKQLTLHIGIKYIKGFFDKPDNIRQFVVIFALNGRHYIPTRK